MGRMMEQATPRATLMQHPHEAAFLQAFDDYADALFRHAALRLSDRERARDAVQDTFVRTWDYLVQGGEVRAWKSFLYRVLNNLIVDEYRRGRTLSLDALLEEQPAETAARLAEEDAARELEEALDGERAASLVRSLIRELPEPHQSAIILRYVDGLSPREAGEALGISENAVSVRTHRALARLKTLCAAKNLL